MEHLTERAAREWLREAATLVPRGQAIVEVGVHQGSSLAALAAGSKSGHGARVYGIDPWGLRGAYPGRPHMIERYGPENMIVARLALQSAGLRATLVRSLSVDAAAKWKRPIGLLFVDAVHREPDVLADYGAWSRHLAPSAVVAFDDYCEQFDGVRRAVDSLFETVEVVGSRLAVARL